jgi:site-specific recombinase XerD
MAANTGANLKGLRDRALLLIGFAGALRRSELVALNIEDIETLTPRLDGGRSRPIGRPIPALHCRTPARAPP